MAALAPEARMLARSAVALMVLSVLGAALGGAAGVALTGEAVAGVTLAVAAAGRLTVRFGASRFLPQ